MSDYRDEQIERDPREREVRIKDFTLMTPSEPYRSEYLNISP